MDISGYKVSELTVVQENHPRPDGKIDPGISIFVRIIPLDANGEPLPVAARAFRRYYRADELPEDLATVLDELLDLVRPTPEEVQKEIQAATEPLRHIHMDQIVRNKARRKNK